MDKFPEAFLKRIKQLLPAAEVETYLQAATAPLPKVVRITDDLEVPSGWKLKLTEVPEAWFIERDNQTELPLGRTFEHFTGQIYAQSLSSMLPVVALNPQPGEKILDLCAAPGSKTTYLASRMQNTGLIVANEPSGTRAKKLAANLDRMAAINTVVVQSDGTILHNFYGQEFDRILLDAPCSSEGYGRRDNKFFSTMWSEQKIYQAAKLQRQLIESAWQMLSPGGIMVYSTCTSAPEENEAVVQHLLDAFPGNVEILEAGLDNIPTAPGLTGWERQKFNAEIIKHARRCYPHLQNEQWNSESFFVVKLQKTEALKIKPPHKTERLTPPKLLKKNVQAEVVTRIAKQFGLPKTWPQHFSGSKTALVERNQSLYLTTPDANQFAQKNLFRRLGIELWDKDQNFSSEFAMRLAPHATKNVLELNAEQAERWRQGYDFMLPEEQNFESQTILVRHKNFGLGWGKVVNGKVKNKLDRDLVG